VIVNHFSGQRRWRSIGGLQRPLATRPGFCPEERVLRQPWQVLSVEPVNRQWLSRRIHVDNF
jgi:hypothetical protein